MHLQFTDAMYNEALLQVEDKVLSMNGNTQTLRNIDGHFQVIDREVSSVSNRDMLRENSYDTAKLVQQLQAARLTNDQKTAFNIIDEVLQIGTGGIVFLDAPGGT